MADEVKASDLLVRPLLIGASIEYALTGPSSRSRSSGSAFGPFRVVLYMPHLNPVLWSRSRRSGTVLREAQKHEIHESLSRRIM